MSLLDFLFPKHCINCTKLGSYLCPKCFSYIAFQEHGLCLVCQRAAIGGITHPGCRTRFTIDGVFSSLVYSGVVKKLVYKFKYKPYITDLQSLLVDLFYEGLIQKEQLYPLLQAPSILIPVPLHPSRMRMRGYNQSMLLSRGLSKRFQVPVFDCLIRVKKTHTQVGLSQSQRKENMKGAFAIVGALPQGAQVFLVDDVATSGATLAESAKMLKKAGVEKVWGMTLAHG